MNAEDVERLATTVAAEWSDVSASGGGASTADGGARAPGAYWPLGSAAPVLQTLPRDRVRFVAAKALGRCLVFSFTLDVSDHQYLLCIDMSDSAADDLRIVAGSVFETVTRLVASPNWAETQRGVLPLSDSATIVLPAR